MNLFIACSASNNIDYKYLEASYWLLKEILKDNDLVYGAYNNGIMKIAYDFAKLYHRQIIAITTTRYEKELIAIDAAEKICTQNVYRRSEELVSHADAILVLPGGMGTIMELISAIEAVNQDVVNKPILIYNIYGFFDELLAALDKTFVQHFSDLDYKNSYLVVNSKEDIISYLNKYKECLDGREN